ncbi:MAG: shikimate dehydrogenase [Rhodospirillales bacterium]|nr:shikimate dehydrogenase [Alphaproteobacteria bacterium]USO04123.1 MAG: shikimate dehydrogenase [Rhodospirillales bacterium]
MSFIKTGVIGQPVAHSKSPLIHGYWIEKYGLAGTYEALEIPPENLESGVRKLIEGGYSGFNVTIPHKESMLSLCDELDETARAIGAVNSVVIKDKKLFGFNTDAFGFVENIRRHQPAFDFTAGAAVVLGAGGAARAVVYALLQEGVPEIVLTNRTEEKARKLASMAPERVKVADWEDREEALKQAALLVNTSSLGMAGNPPLELSLDYLPPASLVHDIVYAPQMTDLLTAAKARGNEIVTGIGMLIHQARPSFESWFGIRPDVTEELEKLVRA